MLSDEEILTIHKALHNPDIKEVAIKGTTYKISKSANSCRKVNVLGILFETQDVNKGTRFAKLAQQGVPITWLKAGKVWGRVVGSTIEEKCSALNSIAKDPSTPTKNQDLDTSNKTPVRTRSTQKRRRRVRNITPSSPQDTALTPTTKDNTQKSLATPEKTPTKTKRAKPFNGTFDENTIMYIHNQLHDEDNDSITIDDTEFAITKNSTGCRQCIIHGIPFVEQNKKKGTKWAKMASQGTKITWIQVGRFWGRIVGSKIERSCSVIAKKDDSKENTTTEVRSREGKRIRRRRRVPMATSV